MGPGGRKLLPSGSAELRATLGRDVDVLAYSEAMAIALQVGEQRLTLVCSFRIWLSRRGWQVSFSVHAKSRYRDFR